MAAPISKRCFWRSRAPGPHWSRRNDVARASRPPPWERDAFLAGAHLGDAIALSLHPAQLVAAHVGAALLADPADADLGVHEPIPRLEQLLHRARLRGAARGGDAVGRAVS